MNLTNVENLKFFGSNVRVYPLAKIIKPEVVSIDSGSQIDDFSFIYGGQGVNIGKRVHIASFVSVIGGGKFTIQDYAGLSAGVRIITGTDQHDGSCLTNSCIPEEFRRITLGTVQIEKHALIFTNCVIFPDVTIGEGAVVGAGALVRKNLEPWTIYAGYDCRKIGSRASDSIRLLEEKMVTQHGY
jgi:acetyltransferase-like isoleucine patch superfamily enzyme